MINVSEQCRQAMAERRDFRCQAAVTLADGTELALDEDAFVLSGNRLTDGAGCSELPLGTAVCRQVRLELANDDERWSGYDFWKAKIRLWLALPLDEWTEQIPLGTFTVVQPETWGETVVINAWDDMYRADRPYETELDFPATLGSMFRDICQRCGISYATADFANESFAVAGPPEEELTFRQVLGYIAMLAGGNARIDRAGRLEIIPYRLGGEPVLELEDWNILKTATDDVVITGLAAVVSEQDENGETTERTVLVGEEGYVLQVDNPLIAGREAEGLSLMGEGLMGLPFRPFQGEHAAYPMAEFMDTVRLRDRKGRTYTSVLTDVTVAFGGATSFANSAAAPVRNGSQYLSPEVRARAAARKMVERERTSRETAMEQLRRSLTGSGGLYSTAQEQPDGSVIYYLHDQPTLDGSGSVMKLTADAIGFSMDGGKTWPFGFSVTGEMVMGIIQAEGLNADWVRFGTLDQARVDGLTEMASGMEVLREQVSATVQSVEKLSGEQIEYLLERMAGLTERADEITGVVSDMQKAIDASNGEIQDLVGAASELRQTANELKVRFDNVEVDHVVTSTGYTFDASGLDISKAGEEMHNQLTNLGMYVRRNEDVILKADAQGVEATDVKINNFLLLGKFSRFEDYTDGADGKRTACFFVG